MDIIGQTRIGYLYLPDGKIIKFALNGLNRSGLKCEDQFIDEHMFKQYEEVESRIRYLKVKPDNIFLDIGACIGSWSIYAAVYGAKVHAFEIGVPHIKTLALNARLNNIEKDDLHIYKTALGSKDNEEFVFDGWMHTYKKPDEYQGDFIIIKSITLDKWVEKHQQPHIDFIKIDVEGMELEVLRGAYHTIKEFEPKMIIEIHEQELSSLRYDVETFLKDLGYNHEHIHGLNDYFWIDK